MVAGKNKHTNSGICDAAQLLCQRFVAGTLTVEGQVACKKQRIRVLCDDLLRERLQQLFRVFHDLAVHLFDDPLKSASVVCQFRRQIMEVCCNGDSH